jgi:hypothetical protein
LLVCVAVYFLLYTFRGLLSFMEDVFYLLYWRLIILLLGLFVNFMCVCLSIFYVALWAFDFVILVFVFKRVLFWNSFFFLCCAGYGFLWSSFVWLQCKGLRLFYFLRFIMSMYFGSWFVIWFLCPKILLGYICY